MARVDIDKIITDTGHSFELNVAVYHSRISTLANVLKTASYKEVAGKVKGGFIAAMGKANETRYVEFKHFEGRWVEPFFNHKIQWMTREEMMSYDLFLETASGGMFNRGEIFILATDLMKREGHSRSIATKHAWFAARHMKNLSLDHQYLQEVWNNRYDSSWLMAQNRRKQWLTPTNGSYYNETQRFLLWVRLFKALIADDEYHAPKEVTKHWVCNIGNTFSHPKYNECEIVQHKYTNSKGWEIVFTCLATGKSYPTQLEHLKSRLKAGIQYKIIEPENKLCLLSYAADPIFTDSDWAG